MDFMKVLDQTVREIKREVNLKVLKVPEIELKMGDHTNPDDVISTVTAPAPPAPIPSRTPASRASDFLEESYRIVTLKQRYDKYRHYVEIKRQGIFDSLVTLYQAIFSLKQRDFCGLHEAFPLPGGISFITYAARAYVSMWFYDLYVSNREAARAIDPIAFTQYYLHEEVHRSYEYDEFLCLLHAAIHPTHIKGISENVMYVPVINKETNWNNIINPFNIDGFTDNFDLAQCVLMRMCDSRAWNISSLVSTTTGRPSWLFDWHDNEMCLAWFPFEGNYTADDVTIAYIIGEACSPNLAYQDVDDWQNFPNNIVPRNVSWTEANRTMPRRFHGTYEVRSGEVREHVLDMSLFLAPTDTSSKKRKTTDASGSDTQGHTLRITGTEPTPTSSTTDPMEYTATVNQYRIVDWIYYVLDATTNQRRTLGSSWICSGRACSGHKKIDNVDLFASQPAFPPPPAANVANVDLFGASEVKYSTSEPEHSTTFDPFAVPDSSKHADTKSSASEATNTKAFDPFAAIPLNNFEESDSFGAFTSHTQSVTTEPQQNATKNSLRSLEQTSSMASKPAPMKNALQVESGVWADSLSRGLIDLNITARISPSNPSMGGTSFSTFGQQQYGSFK
ncbi:uncharacterized protein LOC109837880 isoform X2 [Asparagus officinalis]|uniref:uncharacterized protein LOC109837880 isoform X2 n=1 Tax=Asparagus officinalis TaxID=4686 RepID=UPI00098E4ADD|nr:uncharacterized protein LOC109837880 isoform X2 [Asparagus officinalis]